MMVCGKGRSGPLMLAQSMIKVITEEEENYSLVYHS